MAVVIKSLSGVSDFYEDMLSLMIVTLSLAIFIASTLHTYSRYAVYQQQRALVSKALTFLESIRNYKEFTCDTMSTAGLFSYQKLLKFSNNESYAAEMLKKEFNTEFEFRIQITDVSFYQPVYELNISSCSNGYEHLKTGKYKFEAPICIANSDNEVHAGLLILTVWL